MDGPNDATFADALAAVEHKRDFFWCALKHGMIVAFDDYFCFSKDHVAGEKLALEELLAAELGWRFERNRDFGWAGASFVVEKAGG